MLLWLQKYKNKIKFRNFAGKNKKKYVSKKS